jgi:tetratricopeptide (TPR) repeat protein
VALAAVVVVAIAASLSGLGNGLAQDDAVLLGASDRLHDLGNWREIVTAPFWPPPYSEYLYRPLTSLLLAVEYALGGGAPIVFRFVSVGFYALAAAAVYGLGRRLLPAGVAFGAALLFAAHPVHVEAVAQAVSQSELLVAVAALGMTMVYIDRRRRGEGTIGSGTWILLATLYAGAMLLKETALVIPLLLVASELVLRSPPRASFRRLLPGYAALAVVGAGFVLLRMAVLGDPAGTFPAEALEGAGLRGRALTMLGVVPEWARLLLWPAALSADYSPNEIVAASGFGETQVLGLLLVVAAALLAWTCRHSAPIVSFGVAWIGIGLIPVSNVLIPTGIVLAERTLFLPSVGVVLALAGGAAAVSLRAKRGRLVVAGALAVLVLLGIVRSLERHRVWENDRTLAHAGAVDAPKSYRAQQAYGYALIQDGMPDRGLEAYQRAIALAPSRHAWRVRNDLARRFFAAGRYDLAVDELRHSMRDAPERIETWNLLILGLLGLGSYEEARALADSALAKGGSREVFGGHRALADSAIIAKAPPGSIRVRVVPPGSR